MAEEVGRGEIHVDYDIDDSAVDRSLAKMRARQDDHWKNYNKTVSNALDGSDRRFQDSVNRHSGFLQAMERAQVQFQKVVQDTTRPVTQKIDLDTGRAKVAAEKLRADMDAILKDKHVKADLDDISARLEIERLQAKIAGVKDAHVKADFDDVAAKLKIEGLKLKLDSIRDKKVEVKIDVDKDWSSRFGGVFSKLKNMVLNSGEEGGLGYVGKFASSMLSVLPGRMEGIFGQSGGVGGVAMIAAIVAALAVGLPAIGAMISGTIFAAVGTGGLVAAFMLVKDDPRIKDSLNSLKDTWNNVFNDDTKTKIVQNLLPAINIIKDALEHWAPYLRQIVEAGSTFAGPIANGIKLFGDNILPPLTALMNSPFMKDIINTFAKGLGDIGKAVGDFFEKFISNPQAMEGAKAGLRDLMGMIKWLIDKTGDFLVKMSEMWDTMTKKGADGKSTIDHIKDAFGALVTIVKTLLSPLAAIFGDDGFLGSKRTGSTADHIATIAREMNGITGKGNGTNNPDDKSKGILGNQLKGGLSKVQDKNGDGAGLGAQNGGAMANIANQWQDFKAESAKAWDTIQKHAQNVWHRMNHDWSFAINNMHREWSTVSNALSRHVQAWAHNVGAFFVGWANNVKNWFNNGMHWVEAHYWAWLHNLLAFTAGWGVNIQNWFDVAWGWIKAVIAAATAWISAHYWAFLHNFLAFTAGWGVNIQNWWDDFSRWWQHYWDVVTSWISAHYWAFLHNILAFTAGWGVNIQNWWDDFSRWWQHYWDVVTAWIAAHYWAFLHNLLAFAAGWGVNIQNWWDDFSRWWQHGWDTLTGWIAAHYWAWLHNLLAFAAGWGVNIQNWFDDFMRWMKDAWNTGWGAVKEFFVGIWNDMVNWFKSTWSEFQGWIKSGLDSLGSAWNSAWSGIKDFFIQIFKDIVNACADGINAVIDKINGGAGAINTVMGAVGLDWKIPPIPHIPKFEGGGIVDIPMRYTGGMLNGPGTGTSDSILGIGAGGQATAWVSNGEYVINAKSTAKHLDLIQAINSDAFGYATGGMVGGIPALAGGGLTAAQNAIVQVAQKSGIPFTVNSGFRPGSVSLSGNRDYHSMGLAVDFGSPNMPGLAAYFMTYASALLEEIHSSGGGFFVKNGHRVGAGYYGAEVAGHFDHVHIAAGLEAMMQILQGHVPAGPGSPSGGGAVAGGADGAAAAPLNPMLAKGWEAFLKDDLAPAQAKMTTGMQFADGGLIPSMADGGLIQNLAGGGGVFGALQHAVDVAARSVASSVPAGGFSGQDKPGIKSMNTSIKAKYDAALAAAQSAGGGPNSGNIGDTQVEEIAYKTAKAMGASDAVMMALFEAGFVESGFRNLQTATDHDSLGFLQQRPSAGWPSPLNVETATRSFVSRAMGKSGSPGSIAQAVQVSAFPSRYDQMEGKARAAISAIAAKLAAGQAGGLAAKLTAGSILGKLAGHEQGGEVQTFDNGGYLSPGINYNGTANKELALSASQGDALRKRIEGSDKPSSVYVTVVLDGEVIEEKIECAIDQQNSATINALRRGRGKKP